MPEKDPIIYQWGRFFSSYMKHESKSEPTLFMAKIKLRVFVHMGHNQELVLEFKHLSQGAAYGFTVLV